MGQSRNHTKTLLGIETGGDNGLVVLGASRNHTKTLLGIETLSFIVHRLI